MASPCPELTTRPAVPSALPGARGADVDGVPVQARELVDFTGNRMHVLDAIGSKIVMDYAAVVDGEAAPPPVDDFDLITYLRPSRYCESDSLAPTAAAEFGGTRGAELLDVQWTTPHLVSLGAVDLPRAQYLDLLATAVDRPPIATLATPEAAPARRPR